MAKAKSVFICQNCGDSTPRWQGQCPNCGAWNTLVETVVAKESKSSLTPREKAVNPENIVPFSRVEATSGPKQRLSTTFGELDRVLGSSHGTSGMVPGAVMLIGGEPGIGKSTLLTQMIVRMLQAQAAASAATHPQIKKTAAKIAEQNQPEVVAPFLYISGEESPNQIALRIKRILETDQEKPSINKAASSTSVGKNSGAGIADSLLFVTSTDVDEIASIIKEKQPKLVIVDSIQTLQTEDLVGAEGSVGQVRESTQRITDVVKRYHIPTFLVGHVTKEGSIAGPKVLEHIVDAVLELSGERTDQLRIIRAIKNRFGATDEVGVFKVVENGLAEVSNPSEMLLEHAEKSVPGSATVCVMEGTRPLLVEVQALVVTSQLAMPRRVGRGIELSRIQVLAAVLQKHARLPLGTSDIFVSAAGGFTIREPSVDLGLAVAVASSLKGKSLPEKTVFIGEVGLLGEIRAVTHLERRIKEAKRLGYTQIISRQSHRRVTEVLKELRLV
jgi:DNA repair protein RadA/Sms